LVNVKDFIRSVLVLFHPKMTIYFAQRNIYIYKKKTLIDALIISVLYDFW